MNNFMNKYMEEFMRASKTGLFFALGIFVGTGLFPLIISDDRVAAMAQAQGAFFAAVSCYPFMVAALFGLEIYRSKRREKKKAERIAKKKAAKAKKAAAAETKTEE